MFWRCLLTALFLAFITTNLKAMPFDSTDDAEGRAGVCPEDGLYPNYYNCSTFYQCSNGIAYVYNCPEGTIWNVDNKTCDWPYETECVTYPRDESPKNLDNKKHVLELLVKPLFSFLKGTICVTLFVYGISF